MPAFVFFFQKPFLFGVFFFFFVSFLLVDDERQKKRRGLPRGDDAARQRKEGILSETL